MNKKMVSLAVALTLMAGSPAACAQTALTNSAPTMELSMLEYQETFVHDEATGAWSLTPNAARAALDAIENGYVRGSSTGGTVFFYVALEGNSALNTLLPTLNICYIGSAEVGADAVSLLIDGTRYDFEVAGEVSALGGYRAEIMRAPLNADGMAMLRRLADADEFGVLLHGEKRAYEYEIELEADGEYRNARSEIQAASVECVKNALDICDALGGAGADSMIYAWQKANDKQCAYVGSVIADQPRISLRLDEEFDVLKAGDSSTSVRKLQELLCESGYMYVEPTSRFSTQTRAAVLRAQRELGFVPTGSADAALINALEGGAKPVDSARDNAETVAATPAAGEVAADAGVLYEVDGVARIGVDSYRFAGSIAPSEGEESAAISVSDSDNVLIVFEGEIQSLAAGAIDAAWDYGALVTLDGKYSYECTVAVEQDGGASFGSALIPLGGGRMIAYAEVPAAAAEQEGAWALTLTFGETTLTYAAE